MVCNKELNKIKLSELVIVFNIILRCVYGYLWFIIIEFVSW